ncbi:MAG: hypothetical protein KDD45_02885, partial [Bdellovibrionales bacterium]|nr:hypothetical protein [Bdellovibrionales bacterium]
MYGLMMLIIRTVFTYGAFDINDKGYGIYIDVWGYDEIRKSYYKPALCEAEYIEAQYIDGNLGEYSEYHYNIVGESIDYGSEEWKGIFCEKYNS